LHNTNFKVGKRRPTFLWKEKQVHDARPLRSHFFGKLQFSWMARHHPLTF